MSNFKKDFTDEQKLCIHSHDGTLLVSAAAGSGKTLVLIQRILARITDPAHGTDINRLLVVTFTRAAAAEMKSRLAKELEERIAKDPDNPHLQHQKALLPLAAIETVDSFCNRLVRQHFHALDISPQFRVGEEQQLKLLKNDTLSEVLKEFYTEGNPDFTELASVFSDHRGDTKLAKTVATLYDFLQSHPDPDQWIAEHSAVYEEPVELADNRWARLILDRVTENLEKAKQLLSTALKLLCGAEEKICFNCESTLKDSLQFTENALLLCRKGDWDRLLATLNAYAPLSLGSKKKIEDAVLYARIKALRSEAQEIIKKQVSYLCGNEEQCRQDLRHTRCLIHMLYRVTQRFSHCFAEKKKAANLLDFSDVEHYALQLLTQTDEQGNRIPTPLSQELSSQYDEILVDEYQDTNALQDALYVALSRQESNLFLVGDVKQSIYGFRQAMPELFLQRRSRYPAFDKTHYPATITLGHNFRSRCEVTESVNFVFRQLMTEPISGMAYDENEELKCQADYPPSNGHETEILLIDTTAPVDGQPDKSVAEAIVIAKRIRELVGTLTVGKAEDSRPLRYGDCCILLRSRRPALIKALKEQGIPVEADDSGSFFNVAEIRLALSLLRCIDNPLQDVPLAAWLMSPLCGFTPDDMAAIRLCKPKAALYSALAAARTQVPSPLLAQRCREAVAFLDRYRTLACQMTVDKLLLRLYDDTALLELMSAQTDGERRRRNLQLLQEYCRRFDQNGFRGLSSFIRYVDRLQAQEIELDGATSIHSEDAVRVMTIHRSKGLEFPVVFLAGVSNRFNQNDQNSDLLLHAELGAGLKLRDPHTYNRYRTLPHYALSQAVANDACAEELRVLYVAMTRAKEKLCISMTVNNPITELSTLADKLTTQEALPLFLVRDAKSVSEWLLAALLRHPEATDWRQKIHREDLLPLPGRTPIAFRWETVPSVSEAEASEAPSAAEADPAIVEQIRQNMAYRYPHAALARVPAKLVASQTSEHAVQRRFVAQSQPAFLASDHLTPAERGTAVHNFMLLADYTAASVDLETEIQRLVHNNLLTKAQATAINRKHLTAFFQSSLYQRMHRSPRCMREFPFTAQCPASQFDPTVTDSKETIVMQGIADCLFVEDGELVIVDYKTDRVKSDRELLERYTTQLNVYRASLEKAMDMPVRECLLYSFALDRTIRVEESI